MPPHGLRSTLLACLALGLAVSAAASDPIAYPETRRTDIVDTRFGEAIADAYRWLENDVRGDPEVAEWVRRENAVTNSYLDTLASRAAIRTRLRTLWNYERYGVPRKRGGRYFYTCNSGLQNQSVLLVRDGLDGKERELLDPNGWSRDGATALDEWRPSNDGDLLLYSIQDGGSDWRTLRVLDVRTGKLLDDRIDWVKFSALAWDGDGRGFFYSRFPEPRRGADYQALNLNQQVYYHRIGTPQSADRLLYATPGRPRLNHRVETTQDGRYALVTSSEGTDERFELTLFDLADADPEPRRLVRGLTNQWALAGSIGSRFYFRTNLEAPRQRVVMIDVAARKPKPVEVIPQGLDDLVGATLVGNRLIVAYLGDAKTEAVLYELTGQPAGAINLPDIGTGAGFGGRVGDPETFFAFSSFATPSTIYRFNTATRKMEAFIKPKLAFDPDDYLVDQKFYRSKDGTEVPMFVVRRRTTQPGAPALLYGYGGFNISMTPGFSPAILGWMEMGGVYAVANLRGGGEYGKLWHEAGRLERKQNVFDDFIAAGEYLISSGISAKGRLAAMGRSNGGLLVGAVVNQRPDLFAAASPAVGVMDMLRFTRFTAGRYWIDDYGDPDREADFHVLRGYSPYHNIRSGADYPAILVTTADTDDRVVPGHSFKYAAALQAADIGPRPHLIRVETRAGHGSGKPTDKLIEEYTDLWAFLGHWTGLPAPDKQ
ncbi:prolyl oligopeptidase family serine peptidase [Rhizorhabdus dicambivorans]|uniref:prolyl oligopeptidase n=1 Tax=Rhizorhabdus dicambivorans TaxID=1850238 RepID=A0A2A4FT51_9SPHN|nr:prolyl oligopeptidase family serine peptidase [Rhizorhabdus dicambivorans]ATE64368.1 S9 family peptidase [Rhizorhabdus dicambivorans]PCE40862.1 S9 family peptidase [Rhizorhabdus dicambivorans]